MRKLIIYGALLAAALMIPNKAVELSKMKPMQAVCICIENGELVIKTDTGDTGRGITAADAMRDLKETTAGFVYLDTADYLLVKEGAEIYIPELAEYLKDSVLICSAEGEIELRDVAAFLYVHKPTVKLKEWYSGATLETLEGENGRLQLKEKTEKS